MITEIHIGVDFQCTPNIFINISYALVKFESTWFMVTEKRNRDSDTYLCRLMNDEVSIVDGFLLIRGDDILDTFWNAYILGTIKKCRYHHDKCFDSIGTK